MHVYPTNDPTRAIVIDPATKQPLPAEGRVVARNDPYWLTALRLGDVTLEAPAAETPAAATPATAAGAAQAASGTAPAAAGAATTAAKS